MRIEDFKSLDQATEKDLLLFIIASQLKIIRRLDLLESQLVKDSGLRPHQEATKDMIQSIPHFLERINEYLSLSDEEKMILRL